MERGQKNEGEEAKRNVIAGHFVKVTTETARVPVPHQAKGNACEPQVEIIREGDVIQAIDVICTCGRRIRLHCQY